MRGEGRLLARTRRIDVENANALALDRFRSEVQAHVGHVESALALGAAPEEAVAPYLHSYHLLRPWELVEDRRDRIPKVLLVLRLFMLHRACPRLAPEAENAVQALQAKLLVSEGAQVAGATGFEPVSFGFGGQPSCPTQIFQPFARRRKPS